MLDHNWPNHGCEVSPKCVDCSAPYCVKEQGLAKSWLRWQQVLESGLEGLPTVEIAKRIGCSQRTVQRLIKFWRVAD